MSQLEGAEVESRLADLSRTGFLIRVPTGSGLHLVNSPRTGKERDDRPRPLAAVEPDRVASKLLAVILVSLHPRKMEPDHKIWVGRMKPVRRRKIVSCRLRLRGKKLGDATVQVIAGGDRLGQEGRIQISRRFVLYLFDFDQNGE